MKKLILYFSICFTAFTSCGQSQNKTSDFNLGFENVNDGSELPDNWRPWSKNVTLSIDRREKHSGKVSLLIKSEVKSPGLSEACFDSIPVTFRGNTIELSGFMKTENVSDGFAGFYIRTYSNDRVQLHSNNMQNKMIKGTQDWTQYSITLPLSEDARNIYFGPFLTGTGKLWVDDFRILIDGKDLSEVKYVEPKKYKAEEDKEFDNGSKISSIDLTQFNTDNLDILGKVWGFLKYYHPAIAKGEYNWDYELFRVIPKILSANNAEDRDNILSDWIESLGKTNKSSNKMQPGTEVKLSPDLAWIDNSELGEKLKSQLINIRDAERTDTNYYIGLTQEIGNPIFRNENSYSDMNYPDAGLRLLSLYRYWNIIQYYFPYRYLIEENWNDILKEFIPKFVNAADQLEYKLTVMSLIARIHDTHAKISGIDSTLINYEGRYYPPVKIAFVEDKAVVTDYYDQTLIERSGLQIGDVIETINYKPVDEIVKEKLLFTSASNYPAQLKIIASNLLRSKDSIQTVSVRRGNSNITLQTECFTLDKINLNKYYQKDTCYKLISQEISYIYPGTIKREYLSEIIQNAIASKGLIIDFRCYPSASIFALCEYLLPDSISFHKISIGSIQAPGLFTMIETPKIGHKNENPYKGKVVIIVNEETISQAEFTSMALRSAPTAIVVGNTTAGADGNISKFPLPGSVITMFSGTGIYYPDGKETQRVGIVPDIEVKPTIKGISEGRDELLEKAIQIINEKE